VIDASLIDASAVDASAVDVSVDDVSVIDEPATAAVALDPIRTAILHALGEPGSATTVATALGLARQKVNYHLKMLEDHHLVREVGTRQRRGLTERIVVASASSYVVSPAAFGDLAVDPARTDRLSSRYLIALGARLVREVADLARRADTARQPLATLSIDADICFASAATRAAFTQELRECVIALSAKYHDERAAGGRWHRLMVAAYPRPAGSAPATDPIATASTRARAAMAAPPTRKEKRR
jgi:DNA-binding transcriptional ArsR family regulator